MATPILNEVHLELEKSVSQRVDGKLIVIQISLSKVFYDKYMKFCDRKYWFCYKSSLFFSSINKGRVYDVLKESIKNR